MLRPPRERPTACFCSPLFRPLPSDALSRCVESIHLCVCGSSVSSKLPEQVFPDATPRPAHKAIIRSLSEVHTRAGNRTSDSRFLQNMHDAADDAAVVRPLDAPYIRRQMRFDPSPLLVAQPKQVPAHNPDPLPTTNQDRIVRAKKLMSSDPSKMIQQLTALRGIGVQSATVLVREAFVRRFANGKALGSYAGLASSPYSSGGIDREQGIGKAGNRRVRTVMVELAWLWTRYQPGAAQVCWFRERVASTGRRVRKIMVVALARKLLIALWRFVIDGVLPEGAVLKPAA